MNGGSQPPLPGGPPIYNYGVRQPAPTRPPGPYVPPRKCIFEYTCLCNTKFVYQQELKEHYFKCELMKKHYGDLFTLIVKYNHKDLSVEQKMSLNAVVDMFSNEIKNNVINDAKKNGMQPPMRNDVVYVPQAI